MTNFRAFELGGLALVVFGVMGPRAEAQQFYGFKASPGQLATLASAMVAQAPGCVPTTPPSCYVEKFGCTINVCPITPTSCYPYHAATAPVCDLYCDQAPPPPVTLTVVKNYYVPYFIGNNPPPNVQPVNVEIKWREIHYLSDKNGNPIDKDGKPLPNPPGLIPPPGTLPAPTPGAAAAPSAQHASNGSTVSGAALASALASAPAAPIPAPAVTQAPAPATTTASAITAPAPAATPAKQWVWLGNEGVYGYGYQRADGYWVIDEGSRSATIPTTTASVN